MANPAGVARSLQDLVSISKGPACERNSGVFIRISRVTSYRIKNKICRNRFSSSGRHCCKYLHLQPQQLQAVPPAPRKENLAWAIPSEITPTPATHAFQPPPVPMPATPTGLRLRLPYRPPAFRLGAVKKILRACAFFFFFGMTNCARATSGSFPLQLPSLYKGGGVLGGPLLFGGVASCLLAFASGAGSSLL